MNIMAVLPVPDTWLVFYELHAYCKISERKNKRELGRFSKTRYYLEFDEQMKHMTSFADMFSHFWLLVSSVGEFK